MIKQWGNNSTAPLAKNRAFIEDCLSTKDPACQISTFPI